ncbi:MAG: hypothetical protein NWR45_02730 [Candidatus Nanopelagicales bacterium]|nr:hypothetical protein [Candidatus Nanopelagicales bacterium]
MPETPTVVQTPPENLPPRDAGLGWPNVSRETSPEPGRVAGLGWPA